MSDERQAEVLEAVVSQARILATGLPGALSRLSVTVGEHRVDIEWHEPVTTAAAGAVAAAPAAVEHVAETVSDGHAVVAPLVGTFYLAPEPGAQAFVSEGDLVEAGQQIGIVEAMKIMNRIEADRAGRVAKILVADGSMVEYGQELLIIEPDS
jgi:acetyl-CoA carboxylase biotin carboxyl carrier protein